MNMVREARTIEVTLISATDLQKWKKFGGGEQKCYVVTYIYPARKQISPADLYGGVNPIWNTTLKLTCYETDLHPAAPGASSSSSPSSRIMTVEIYSHGGGILHSNDKLIGTVVVSLQDVVSAAKVGDAMRAFEVHLPSGGVQGTLNLSVKLGAKRELGEYEDLTAAVPPSYSNYQGAPSSSKPLANDQVPSTKPSTYTSKGQWASDNDPPTKSNPMMNRATPNKNTVAEEDDVVTGYPAPGPGYPAPGPGYPAPGPAYAFAPLGQLPTRTQGGRDYPTPGPGYPTPGPGTSNHGPYAVGAPEGARYMGPIGGRREQRRARKRGDGRRHGGPIHLGIRVLQTILAPAAQAMGNRRQSADQHQIQDPSSSSSQQSWKPEGSSTSSQQTRKPEDSNYGYKKGPS